MQSRPWSNKQLQKLSDSIRDGHEPDEYEDVMLWFNDLAANVQQRIESADWTSSIGDLELSVSSRPKTIDTLQQKLIRQPNHSIATIWDIAGVRAEADMTLSQQTELAHALACFFDHDPALCISDTRQESHSGYRAVHLRLKLEGRVEVQIRTRLQGQWANTYERAADVLGREIRYGEMPKSERMAEIVTRLQRMSEQGVRSIEDMGEAVSQGIRQVKTITEQVATLPSDVGEQERAEAQKNHDDFKELERRQQAYADDYHNELKQLETMFDELQQQKVED